MDELPSALRSRLQTFLQRIVLPALCGLLACTVTCGIAEPEAEFYLGGIQVNEPDMGHWHRSLLRHGFNTVSLTVYARQHRWDSAELEFVEPPQAPDLVREMRAAATVGLRRVLVLRLALDHAFAENSFLWHGMVSPRTDAEVDAWFYRYGQFARAWAEVAQREGVEVLGIGSELAALTNTRAVDGIPGLERYYLDQAAQAEEAARLQMAASGGIASEALQQQGWRAEAPAGEQDLLAAFVDARAAAQAAWALQVTGGEDVDFVNRRRRRLEHNWRRLIDEIREVYSGQLTYAANFDQVEHVAFWDALDLLAVNAYYPLRETLQPEAPLAELSEPFVERWEEILGGLDRLRVAAGVPEHRVLITEIGYTARRGSTLQPWAGSGFAAVPLAGNEPRVHRLVYWDQQPREPGERAAAIEALAQASVGVRPPLLAGALYWKLSTVPEHRDIEPFVVILGEHNEDPVVAALRRLGAAASQPRAVPRRAE